MTFAHFTARTRDRQILIVTGGHPFDATGFFNMLDQTIQEGLNYNWSLASHPAAQSLLERPDSLSPFDAIVFYDVPGQDYRTGAPPLLFEPTEAYKAGLETLLEQGMPMLFLHHAIVGWASWPRYGEIIGGCVMSQPGELRGRPVPDSGYRFDVQHTVYPVADHPIVAGLDGGFEIVDQLYMGEVFEDTLVPLLRSDYDFSANGFYSIAAAAQGRINSNEGWTRGPGSNLMGWTRRERNSDIVYLQCGDGPSAYDNPHFQQLIRNSVQWLAERNPSDRQPLTRQTAR